MEKGGKADILDAAGKVIGSTHAQIEKTPTYYLYVDGKFITTSEDPDALMNQTRLKGYARVEVTQTPPSAEEPFEPYYGEDE